MFTQPFRSKWYAGMPRTQLPVYSGCCQSSSAGVVGPMHLGTANIFQLYKKHSPIVKLGIWRTFWSW